MKRIALAFSGGLDTSYCAVWLREQLGYEVVTVTVDTGGFHRGQQAEIERRARELGAAEHHTVDGRSQVWERFVRYLIKGNVLRGGVYPLCVAAERCVQAEEVARIARQVSAEAVAHGSTGAGNDGVRFDVAFYVHAPGLKIVAPIREGGVRREQSSADLRERGFAVPERTATYSVNAGLWGITVGGGATHDPWAAIPDDVFVEGATPEDTREAWHEVVIHFLRGVPVRLDDQDLDGLALADRLNFIGRGYGIGRGIHIGDTILGLKGRIAFEAPAPVILVHAHRELEKLVLTRQQQFWARTLGELYGNLLHEGQYYEPLARDLEAFLDSVQRPVTGEVRVRLARGQVQVTGVRSRHSLMDVATMGGMGRYGEQSSWWDGRDAGGFARLYALPSVLAARRGDRLPLSPTVAVSPEAVEDSRR